MKKKRPQPKTLMGVEKNGADEPARSLDASPSNNMSMSAYKLPEKIPESWLDELKNAVKEGRSKLIVTTILSSSLLTGVLGVAANFYLERMKSNLEIKTARAKNRLESYSLLGKDVGKFESDLDSAIKTLRYAQSHPENKDFEENIGRSIDVLSEQMIVLNKTITGPNIDADTRNLIKVTIRPLGPTLAAAQSDHSSEVLTDVIGTSVNVLNEGIPNIKNQIDKAMGTINTDQ